MAQIVQYIHISGQGRMGLFSKEFVIFNTIFPQQKKKSLSLFLLIKMQQPKYSQKPLFYCDPQLKRAKKNDRGTYYA